MAKYLRLGHLIRLLPFTPEGQHPSALALTSFETHRIEDRITGGPIAFFSHS